MPISFACVCGKGLKAPDGAAGKTAKCPGCGGSITVPDPKNEPILVPGLVVEDDDGPDPQAGNADSSFPLAGKRRPELTNARQVQEVPGRWFRNMDLGRFFLYLFAFVSLLYLLTSPLRAAGRAYRDGPIDSPMARLEESSGEQTAMICLVVATAGLACSRRG